MKKGGTFLLIGLTLAFAGFLAGMLVGRNIQSQPVSIELATKHTSMQSQSDTTDLVINSSGLININTASESILDTLPGIGKVLAGRIVEYRQEHGPFEKTTDLSLVEGIGHEKLLAILDLITVED
jgi:competence protein ComEA